MTVRELIEELEKYPQDYKVALNVEIDSIPYAAYAKRVKEDDPVYETKLVWIRG